MYKYSLILNLMTNMFQKQLAQRHGYLCVTSPIFLTTLNKHLGAEDDIVEAL